MCDRLGDGLRLAFFRPLLALLHGFRAQSLILSTRPLLLQRLQSGYPFSRNTTAKGLWGILYEGFHPARNTPCFPEERCGRLTHDHGEIIRDRPTGKREGWPMTLIIKFQVASGMLVTKGVVCAAQSNNRISYFNSALFCHDPSILCA